MFKKDEYIVITCCSGYTNAFSSDFIYKQRENSNYLQCYLDNNRRENGLSGIRPEKGNGYDWRYATEVEKEMYELACNPLSIIPQVGGYIRTNSSYFTNNPIGSVLQIMIVYGLNSWRTSDGMEYNSGVADYIGMIKPQEKILETDKRSIPITILRGGSLKDIANESIFSGTIEGRKVTGILIKQEDTWYALQNYKRGSEPSSYIDIKKKYGYKESWQISNRGKDILGLGVTELVILNSKKEEVKEETTDMYASQRVGRLTRESSVSKPITSYSNYLEFPSFKSTPSRPSAIPVQSKEMEDFLILNL